MLLEIFGFSVCPDFVTQPRSRERRTGPRVLHAGEGVRNVLSLGASALFPWQLTFLTPSPR